MIAALFVERNGAYANLPGVDAWDGLRDARFYMGPHPVVAHPPCSRWCQLAHINQKRYGHKVGEDGGCFASALRCVNHFGGVLEHPKGTLAWKAFDLPKPKRGRWLYSNGAYVTEVFQGAYGHRALKATWLYYVGRTPPDLNWEKPTPTAQVSFCKNHGNSPLPRLSKKEASATPPAFRDVLIEIARDSIPHAKNRKVHGNSK